MSKVVHLSDEAHTAAKNFCKQHGLKMSDWVAELIGDAIVNKRVSPSAVPPPPAARPRPAVPSPAAASHHQPTAASHTPSNNGTAMPVKKRLERLEESATEVAEEGVPPWAAPPFWARAQSK